MDKQRTRGPGRRRAPTQASESDPKRKTSAGLWALLDAVPGAWFFTRRDGSFAHVSPGACEALGYSREELLSVRVFDLEPAMNAERWATHWESLRLGQSRTSSAVLRRRDGTEYPIERRSHELEVDGEVLSASCSVHLTASDMAASSATEAQLPRLLERLPDMVFRLRFGPRPMLEFVSASSKALLGYWPTDLVGDEHAFARIVHPDDREQLLRLHEPPCRTALEVRFLDRDQRLVWMDLRVAPVTSRDGVPLIEGVARDVTQSHHADQQSRRLLAAIEQAAEAVVVTNGDGIVEYVNPAYRQSTGIAQHDAVARPWRELEVKSDEAFLRRLSAALGKGEIWRGRVRSERHGGTRYDEDATLAPILDASGQKAGCVAVKRDVTEQLALDEQLHQAQKLEAVGQLAGGIAHDFNNLLHVIQGHTHMMQALDLDGFAHKRDLVEMLGEVDKATERAVTLVRQLLAFSRKGGAEFSELRLDALVTSLHGMLHRILGPGIQLMLRCNAGHAVILGNAAQLEQMITNLCLNARDAMRTGGYLHITLTPAAATDLPRLFRNRTDEPHVRLTVRDEGAGMSRDVQRRLYEPFFTTKQPGEGVGLGLATVYAIVQGHRGFIDSTSARGQGTTFDVYLPCIDARAPVGPRPPTRAQVDGRGRLVLLAEDEPAVLQLTSCYLRQAGFEVMPASNGPEAERLLDERGGEIVLAVLDAVMPGFGGQGVHRAMKDRNIDAPALFVTGYDYQTLAGVAGEEGVAILQKPFGQSELLDQVARLLKESA